MNFHGSLRFLLVFSIALNEPRPATVQNVRAGVGESQIKPQGSLEAMKVSTTQSHEKRMRKSQSLALSMVLLGAAISASAHSIDYVATNISPTSMFNGQSGNFTV